METDLATPATSQNDPTVEQYSAGVPLKDIVAEHGVTRQTVFNRLKRAGITPGRKSPYSDETIAKAVAAYKAGKPAHKVAEDVGCNVMTIHAWLKAAKVKTRTAKDYRDTEMLARTAKLYREGMSTTEIAKVEGVAQSAVVARLRRAGVTARSQAKTKATKTPKTPKTPKTKPSKTKPSKTKPSKK